MTPQQALAFQLRQELERNRRRWTPEQALAICLDWLDNLEVTVGSEVLVNHMPNNVPSRATMRALLGQEHAPKSADTIEHRMFVKEQRRLLRAL